MAGEEREGGHMGEWVLQEGTGMSQHSPIHVLGNSRVCSGESNGDTQGPAASWGLPRI